MKTRTVIHCSDLHFGRGCRKECVKGLLRKIESAAPDAVVISGDLTLRGRKGQFKQAREFLSCIPPPILLIPGNHDVPLYSLFRRLLKPFANYTEGVADMGVTQLVMDTAAILGINSVNPFRHQKGRITPENMNKTVQWLDAMKHVPWRIVAVHQHMANVTWRFRPGRMHNAASVVNTLAQHGAHAILSGHVHYHNVSPASEFFPNATRPILLVSSGTAANNRVRGRPGETNSINLLTFSDDLFSITPCYWNPEKQEFLPGETKSFNHDDFAPAETPAQS